MPQTIAVPPRPGLVLDPISLTTTEDAVTVVGPGSYTEVVSSVAWRFHTTAAQASANMVPVAAGQAYRLIAGRTYYIKCDSGTGTLVPVAGA